MYLYCSLQTQDCMKFLIFVNSISYVYRLVPLLRILLNSHQHFKIDSAHKKRRRSQNVDKLSSAQHPRNTSTTYGTKESLSIPSSSPGCRYLSDLLKALSSSDTPSSVKESESSIKVCSSQDAVLRRKKTSYQHNLLISAHVYGIHSKMKQSRRFKQLAQYVKKRNLSTVYIFVGLNHQRHRVFLYPLTLLHEVSTSKMFHALFTSKHLGLRLFLFIVLDELHELISLALLLYYATQKML